MAFGGSTMLIDHACANVRGISGPNDLPADNSAQPVRPDARDAELLDAYSQAVINVVEKTSPAVISVTGRQGDRERGSGSGFLFTPDGYAVTNSHVVAGRTRLLAETTEGDRVDIEVIGNDPATDLAVL